VRDDTREAIGETVGESSYTVMRSSPALDICKTRVKSHCSAINRLLGNRWFSASVVVRVIW
jgi:hypothetical protein